jgi:hypothetical protein
MAHKHLGGNPLKRDTGSVSLLATPTDAAKKRKKSTRRKGQASTASTAEARRSSTRKGNGASTSSGSRSSGKSRAPSRRIKTELPGAAARKPRAKGRGTRRHRQHHIAAAPAEMLPELREEFRSALRTSLNTSVGTPEENHLAILDLRLAALESTSEAQRKMALQVQGLQESLADMDRRLEANPDLTPATSLTRLQNRLEVLESAEDIFDASELAMLTDEVKLQHADLQESSRRMTQLEKEADGLRQELQQLRRMREALPVLTEEIGRLGSEIQNRRVSMLLLWLAALAAVALASVPFF